MSRQRRAADEWHDALARASINCAGPILAQVVAIFQQNLLSAHFAILRAPVDA
jgi:hypothetical protein